MQEFLETLRFREEVALDGMTSTLFRLCAGECSALGFEVRSAILQQNFKENHFKMDPKTMNIEVWRGLGALGGDFGTKNRL